MPPSFTTHKAITALRKKASLIHCDRLRTSAARYVADLHVNSPGIKSLAQPHLHISTSLQAKSNCLNTKSNDESTTPQRKEHR